MKCKNCEKVIIPHLEFHIIRIIDTITSEHFCDEYCLIEYMKDNGEIEEV